METCNSFNYKIKGQSEVDFQRLFKDNFFNDFMDFFKNQSSYYQELAIRKLSISHQEKFPRVRNAKYGNIDKGFSEEEFYKFIKNEENPKAKLAWQFQYLRGFRINEIPLLNYHKIDWNKKTWKVWTSKAKQWDTIIIKGEFEILLKNWILERKKEILENDGYIFYSDNSRRKKKNISHKWLNKQFGITRKKAGLTEIYGYTKPNGNKMIPKPQYILSSHSFRHSAITRFYNNNNKDIVLTQKFARHKDIKSTLVYIYKTFEELQSAFYDGNFDKNQEIKYTIQELIEQELNKREKEKGDLATGTFSNSLGNYHKNAITP